MDGPDANVPRTGADASASAGACSRTREAEAGREEESRQEARTEAGGEEEGREEAGAEEGREEEGRQKAGEEEGGQEEGREAARPEEGGAEGEEDLPEESRQEEREVSPAQRPGPPGRFSTRPSRPDPMRLVLAVVAAAACSPSPVPSTPAPAPAELTAEFQQQFQRSANDWNRGDLDSFMSDYARDSLTTFVAGGHLSFGYDRIQQGYAAQFAPGARRDSLRFEEFHVRVLSPTLALVNARYILYRDGATTSSGPFTLVMERQADGWKILHDHTHSDPR